MNVCKAKYSITEENNLLKQELSEIKNQLDKTKPIKNKEPITITKTIVTPKIVYINKNDNNITDNTVIYNKNSIKYFSYDQQLYFKAKDIMVIIGYEDTKQFIKNNIDDKYKFTVKSVMDDQQLNCELKFFLENQEPKTIYINKDGYNQIIDKSKKDTKDFNRWFNTIYDKLLDKTVNLNQNIITDRVVDSNNFNLFYDNVNIKYFILDDNLYFKGKDIASYLEYENTTNAITNNVNKKDIFTVSSFLGDTPGGAAELPPLEYSNSLQNNKKLLNFLQNQDPQTVYINESGLYKLVMNSKKPEAEKFQDWVTSDVLISIRKTGEYKMKRTPYDITKLHQMIDKNCVYILYLHDNIYKFGKTSSLNTRLSTHKSKLDYNNIVQLFDFPTVRLMERFENIIRLYIKENKINIKYCNNDVKGIEFFQTTNEEKMLIDLSAMYNNMIIEYETDKQLDEDNNSIVQIEKTKSNTETMYFL
jgi:prophage antirepressor-like protein/predicted GIY-YIG superfamily endonuclease